MYDAYMNKGNRTTIESLSHFMDEELKQAEEQYRSLIERMDALVEQGVLRKSGYKYENNPRRRSNARDEKTTLNLIRTADGMRASVTMVRRAIDEMKRAKGAIVSNAKSVENAHATMIESSKRFETHSQQHSVSREREIQMVSDGKGQSDDSHHTPGPKGKAMAKKTSKKKASKKTAAKAESNRINYDELSDNQRGKMLNELGNELVACLESGGEDSQAAARGLRAKLRRVDADWTENCRPYAAYKKAQAKSRESAAPKKTTKKVSKKKTSKKKVTKKKASSKSSD